MESECEFETHLKTVPKCKQIALTDVSTIHKGKLILFVCSLLGLR